MTKRKPDPLWDVAVELCNGGGAGPITQSERGKWNKGLKELRDAGATPEQLRAAIAVYKRRNKGCACNPLAIAGQWGKLLAEGRPSIARTAFIDLLARWHDIPLAKQHELASQISLPPLSQTMIPQAGTPNFPAENFATPYMVSESLFLLRQALALWDKEQP